MIKLQAVNNVVILQKDKSVNDSPIILPQSQPSSPYEIPEPYTGTIDSVGVENEWKAGDRVAFDSLSGLAGAIYMKIDDKEYVVITPDMIIGKLG